LTFNYLLLPMWQGMCGNKRIDVYGRIIDENGLPISEAIVTYRITYSNRIAAPFFYGRVEKSKTVSTTTDRNGDYCICGEYGYVINLSGVQLEGVWLTSAMGIPSTKETGWLLDSRSDRARMPNTETHRITYIFSRR